MIITAKTDAGMIREYNQDCCAAGEFPSGAVWAVVCDGMGGAAAGDLASSMAVKLISEKLNSLFRADMSEKSIRNMLLSAVDSANLAVYELSLSNPDLEGMGTTVVTALVDNGFVYIAHAGDSRAYKLSDGKLIQLTKDHSVVQEMVENGELTESGARNHPSKNLITRALGVDKTLSVDFGAEPFSDGDVLIICTDGLTNFVEPADIYKIVNELKSGECAEKLVERANKNGGGDNITVVTVSA